MARPTPYRSATTAAALALLVLLSSCGGDQEKSADGAEDALSEYFKDIGRGDSDACDRETDEYEQTANEAFAEFTDDGDTPSCKQRVDQTRELLIAFGYDLDDAEFEAIGDVDGDEARVRVTYPDDSQSEETYVLVYEDGEWLVNEDDSTSDSGESEEFDEGDSDESEMSQEEAVAQGDAWIDAWCDVQLDQTRDEAIALMGEPTSEATAADDADPHISWSLGPYDFTAFLDTDGLVNGFYANYDSLGQSDLDRMPCVAEDDGYIDRIDD